MAMISVTLRRCGAKIIPLSCISLFLFPVFSPLHFCSYRKGSNSVHRSVRLDTVANSRAFRNQAALFTGRIISLILSVILFIYSSILLKAVPFALFPTSYQQTRSIMGLLDHVSGAVTGGKHHHHGVKPSKEDQPPEGASADDTEELDEESGNILMSLIGQLRIGMDLSKVTLPTFVLEPRSMLERITDFMSHPDLIFGIGEIDDPEKRFLQVTRYYLSGWHIKPKGVKKPYNPVLGEHFRCSYKYPNDTEGFYIAEQVSHHPPISAYFYCSPANKLMIYGELKPKSKFLGNSAATLMGGENRVVLLDRPEDKEYEIGMPNMYARGILFGKMVLELGDQSKIRNEANDIHADVEFKTKGYFTGTYNAISGKVVKGGKTVGELHGKWNETMEYKHSKSGETEILFDATKAKTAQKTVRPQAEQEDFESEKLWSKVTEGIKEKNLDKATDNKTAIEDAQRQRVKEREEKGETWTPKYFVQKGEKFYPKVDALPAEMQADVVKKYFDSL